MSLREEHLILLSASRGNLGLRLLRRITPRNDNMKITRNLQSATYYSFFKTFNLSWAFPTYGL
jgi:hypothetical protein